MDTSAPPSPNGLRPRDITGALAWWREAGVDMDFGDEPTHWLPAADHQPSSSAPAGAPVGRAAAVAAEAAPPVSVPFGGDRTLWPGELDAFARWWMEEPLLDDGQVRGRIAPRGRAGAPLMVIVPQPEADDAERLLDGPEGRLLDAMLSAMGLTADGIYLAAVLPRHTPLVDWPRLCQSGAGALLAHHVRLARPQRAIVFGSTVLPLLGHDPTHSAQILPAFNHEGGSVPLLAARELGALLARPQWKAGFWRNWLDWTGPSST